MMITDDHPVVTNGLEKIFNHHPQVQVIGTFQSGKALLQALKNTTPDVMLLDLHLPDMEGPELVPMVLEKNPDIKIIILSSSDIIVQVKKMLHLGCSGYLLKDSDDATIVQAVEVIITRTRSNDWYINLKRRGLKAQLSFLLCLSIL